MHVGKIGWIGALSPLGAILLLPLFCGTSAAQTATPTLTGCAGHTPPFVQMENGVGANGFSVELFQKIAQKLQRQARIVERPWARCLDEVRSGKIDVAIDAYDDPGRRKIFHYSIPYYTLTPQIFYLASAAPDKLPAHSVAKLRELRGCGLYEYTYEHYDLNEKTMDLGASSDKQMLQKLIAKRCDYAVEELEYVVGGRNTVADWPDEAEVRSYRPAWARGPKLHFLVGHQRAGGQALQIQLNQAITALQKQGETERLGKLYFQSKPVGKP